MPYTCSFIYIIYVFCFIPMHLSSTLKQYVSFIVQFTSVYTCNRSCRRDESKTSFVYSRVFVQ